MTLTTHALTGAVIGKNIENIWLVILVSLIFHFVLDALRHGDYVQSLNQRSSFKNTWWKVALDLTIGLTIVFSSIFWQDFSWTKTRNLLAGSFFSMFPDLLTFLYWKFKWQFLEKIYHFNEWIHLLLYQRAEDKIWRLRNNLNDILISTLAIWLLFFLR